MPMDPTMRRALLLVLAVLEEHSRALRTLLMVEATTLDFEDTLGSFTRHERAIEATVRELHARARRVRAADAARRREERRGEGAPRQGVLPLA